MLHQNLKAVHDPMSSHCLIWMNNQRILNNPQNGFFKGIFFFFLTDGEQMKHMKQELGQWWNSTICQKFPVPIQHMAVFYNSAAEPDRDVLTCLFEAMYRQIQQAG